MFAAGDASGFYEEAVAHGVSAGALAPCAMGAGLGIARCGDADANMKDAIHVLPDLHLMAGFVHTAIDAIASNNAPPNVPCLTKRELECLKLAALGKCNCDIADRLNLAEPTVWMHMGNASRKLKGVFQVFFLAQFMPSNLGKTGLTRTRWMLGRTVQKI
jgi:DNA-binding CsgD family transcriptional regulator